MIALRKANERLARTNEIYDLEICSQGIRICSARHRRLSGHGASANAPGFALA